MTDPIAQFKLWLEEATQGGEPEPTAMALATSDTQGNPAVRMVLLKHVDVRGFVFYTNLTSPKAENLASNPKAELCFYWNRIGRQVRVRGRTEPVSTPRPTPTLRHGRGSASSAHGPRSSRARCRGISTSSRLAPRMRCAFTSGPCRGPRSGPAIRVVPDRIEFWRQKPFRRHERIVCMLEGGGWREQWLYP